MIKIIPRTVVALKLTGWRYLDLEATHKETVYRPLAPAVNGSGYELTLQPFCYITATVSICLKVENSLLDTHVSLHTLQEGKDENWTYECEGYMLNALQRSTQIDIIEVMEVWQASEGAYEVMLDNLASVALTLCVGWEDLPLSFPFALLPVALSPNDQSRLKKAVQYLSYHTGLSIWQIIKYSTVNCLQRYVLMALLGLPETLIVEENSEILECRLSPDVTQPPNPQDPAFVFHYHRLDNDKVVLTTYVKGLEHWASVKTIFTVAQAQGFVWSRMIPPFYAAEDPQLKLKVYDAGRRFTVDGKTWPITI
nr:ORF72 [Acipenserid herpesvirus 1]